MNQSDALMGALHLLREEIGGIRRSLERIESGLEDVLGAGADPISVDAVETRDSALESPIPSLSVASETPGIDDLLGGFLAAQEDAIPAAPPIKPAAASPAPGSSPSDDELESLLANRVAAPSPLVPTTGPRTPPQEIAHAPAAAPLEDDPDRFDLSVNALEEIFGTDKDKGR